MIFCLQISSPLLPSPFFSLILDEQFHIKAYAMHEEVDICKALARHRRWQCLSKSDCFHDTILDSHDKSLLLVGTRSDADGGEELPYIHIFTGIDSTGEYMWKCGLQCIKELIIR